MQWNSTWKLVCYILTLVQNPAVNQYICKFLVCNVIIPLDHVFSNTIVLKQAMMLPFSTALAKYISNFTYLYVYSVVISLTNNTSCSPSQVDEKKKPNNSVSILHFPSLQLRRTPILCNNFKTSFEKYFTAVNQCTQQLVKHVHEKKHMV